MVFPGLEVVIGLFELGKLWMGVIVLL